MIDRVITIFLFFSLFYSTSYSQCNTTVTPIDYCANQFAESDVDNIDVTANYRWYDQTGTIPYNFGTHFVSPTTIPGAATPIPTAAGPIPG